MKQFKVIGILTCLLLLTCGCGKKEEAPDMTQTDAVVETEPETEETSETEEESTEEPTTEEETESTEETEEATEETEETTESSAEQTDAPAQEAPAEQLDATVPETPSPAPVEAPVGDDVTFRFNGTTLRVGDNVSGFVSAVKENSYESAQSCYGNGEDINYYYDDFTIYVWNENGNYMTVGIDITGSGAATQKGITIGSTVNDVIAAYGNGYTEDAMDYVYTYGDCNLRFTILDGQVHYISYNKDI